MKMTAENNRKYIAEAWIENGKEEEFKKSFLNALIEQWQGHRDDGSGFNADKLDGKHLSYFDDYFECILNNTIKTFQIGFQTIIPTQIEEIKKYKLGFEAIQLFLPGQSGYLSDELKLPWDAPGTSYAEGDIPSLHETFRLLYEKINEIMVSKECFNEKFCQPFYGEGGYIEDLDKLATAIHNIDSDGNINAQTINGLRFYVLTQAQYDREKREHPDKVNNIHNVFIIKSAEDLAANGYPDYYDGNPDIAAPDKYYRFRVATVQEGERMVKKLQYCYDFLPDEEAIWRDIDDAINFLDMDYIDKEINDKTLYTIENHDNYIINKTSFLKTISAIKEDENNPIDIIGFDNFITGAHYINDGTKTLIPIETVSNKRYLNLTNFNTEIKNRVNAVSTNLNNYKDYLEGANRTGGVLGTMKGNISGNTSEISQLSTQLTNLNSAINTLSNNVNNLTTKVNKITTWKQYVLGGLRRLKDKDKQDLFVNNYLLKGKTPWPKGIYGSSVSLGDWYITRVRYNESLGIACMYFSIMHYHLAKNAGDWVKPAFKYGNKAPQAWSALCSTVYGTKTTVDENSTNDYWRTKLPTKLWPISTATAVGPNHHRFLQLDPANGEIQVLADYSKDTYTIFYGEIFYKINPL